MNSIWSRILDLISPRSCSECGCRLSLSEDVVCGKCNFHLPRTFYSVSATDNEMARLFWGLLPVTRAAALFFYQAHAPASSIIYKMKYGGHPEIGEYMGRMAAREFVRDGFFEDDDIIIPVPLTAKRRRKRGYNQSEEIARGVGSVTGLPVVSNAVTRDVFTVSQTQLIGWQRRENVRDCFTVKNAALVKGRHVLVIDDVVTTGATVTACAAELVKAGASGISVMSLAFTKD